MKSPEEVVDVLTGVLRNGAMRLLTEALEIEIESFIKEYKGLRLSNACRSIVRNGYNKPRNIQTGIGEVKVRVPRAEDREEVDDKIRLQSCIVPPYIRRTKSIEALLPWLYLKGISTVIFRKHWDHCLAKEPGDCRPAPSVVLNLCGGMNMRSGINVIYRKSIMFTFGLMGFTVMFAWIRTSNACR